MRRVLRCCCLSSSLKLCLGLTFSPDRRRPAQPGLELPDSGFPHSCAGSQAYVRKLEARLLASRHALELQQRCTQLKAQADTLAHAQHEAEARAAAAEAAAAAAALDLACLKRGLELAAEQLTKSAGAEVPSTLLRAVARASRACRLCSCGVWMSWRAVSCGLLHRRHPVHVGSSFGRHQPPSPLPAGPGGGTHPFPPAVRRPPGAGAARVGAGAGPPAPAGAAGGAGGPAGAAAGPAVAGRRR